MQLTKTLRNHLAKEYRFIAQQMETEAAPLRKMYFFSAVYGEAARSLNREWDDDLALIHLAINAAYQQVNTAALQISAGNVTFSIDPQVFDLLAARVRDLGEIIGADVPDRLRLLDVMSEIATAAFSVSGNGQFLSIKGHLKLSEVE